ncbi:MAG: Prolyl oligopeptidase family protein [uncultured Thermomicrobiales bacterium]|uniref:Prolyl oligopeptidase family protein n=1 Tax=uncultured Thermomicrobiales bacterium TaxID=1645740 RepID=A0A6J4TFB7_9BACT|nr:MAG: Prolyl oligopeptidase family protein [uncultured Thermomicrobiales bacterium]
MTEPRVTPYGSWVSPIGADLVAGGSVRLNDVQVDGDAVLWAEGRPEERGRQAIVRWTPDGGAEDVNPAPFNARTGVHEYGGGAFVVDAGTVWFSHFGDGRLYRVEPGHEPRPITPEGAYRYADLAVDRGRNRLLAVREDHTGSDHEPVNAVVAVDADGAVPPVVLVSGHHFYSSPRVSPGGERMSWLAWNHPNMPWDGTELWVAEIGADGAPGDARMVAGGEAESVFQPSWSPGGVLHFVSDRTGWWNLYAWRDGAAVPLCPMDAEFGLPEWVFGRSTYAFLDEDRIACAFVEQGAAALGVLDVAAGSLTRIPGAETAVEGVRAAPGSGWLVFAGGGPGTATALVRVDLGTGERRVVRRTVDLGVEAAAISQARAIEFSTTGGTMAHAFFYPPRNPAFRAPEGERPPLLVMSHGGPTSATTSALSPKIQYWTSRGIAVLDVNYGGSTGYGRAYRERLNGNWGVVDLDDCVNGARHLVGAGEVDGDRLAITGGSAGGYTTLCALTFRDVFKAGASYYGIGDLETMVRDTHKFEARYFDRLIAPYSAGKDIYVARSPIHFIAGLSEPVIFFQGAEDKVVPPNQAEDMVAALRAKGIATEYVLFEGEGHGFRQAPNIRRALEAELAFYARVFGFEPAGSPVPG